MADSKKPAEVVVPLLTRLEEIYDDYNARASYDAVMRRKANTVREAIIEICRYHQTCDRIVEIRKIAEHVEQMLPPRRTE